MLIRPDQLQRICKTIQPNKALIISDAINKVCPLYGFNTDILHEFLANVIHESKEFNSYEESLYYSAERILEVWPKRFKTIQEALPYAKNPRKLGNKVYGGRLGNSMPEDGWNYRGSGPIQITGKENVSNFAKFLKKVYHIDKSPEVLVHLIRSDHEIAMHSACWVFSIAKGLNEAAMNDNMNYIIKKINGGFIGMSERMKYYNRCLKEIPLQ